MIKREKCIEYYFDSKKYNQIQIIENMEKEKLEFPKEQVDLEIFLNEYGIYEVKLVFSNNKISIIRDTIKEKIQDKMQCKIQNVQDVIKKYIKRDVDSQVHNRKLKIFSKYKIKRNYYTPI